MGSEIKSAEEAELASRLDKIENKLDFISSSSGAYGLNVNMSRSGQIDLRGLWDVIWRGKWVIFIFTIFFTILGVIYVFSLPNIYRSEGIYAAAQKKTDAAGIASQLGGLAAIAGINIGASETSDTDQALALLNSWQFVIKVIEDNNLKPLIMAVTDYDINNDQFKWDLDVYNPNKGTWGVGNASSIEEKPLDYEVYKKFRRMYAVSQDAKTGLITISIEYFSPEYAQNWVTYFVVAVNNHFQKRDILESHKSISYLESRIKKTSVSEMNSVFYGMIENQMKKLMLAEVSEEYLLKTVVPPGVSRYRVSPRKGMIIVVFFSVGLLISMPLIFLRWKKNAVEHNKSK